MKPRGLVGERWMGGRLVRKLISNANRFPAIKDPSRVVASWRVQGVPSQTIHVWNSELVTCVGVKHGANVGYSHPMDQFLFTAPAHTADTAGTEQKSSVQPLWPCQFSSGTRAMQGMCLGLPGPFRGYDAATWRSRGVRWRWEGFHQKRHQT